MRCLFPKCLPIAYLPSISSSVSSSDSVAIAVGIRMRLYLTSPVELLCTVHSISHLCLNYGAQTFTGSQIGLTYFNRSNATGFERLSGYRFHIADPLAFTDGAKMVWKVGGACISLRLALCSCFDFVAKTARRT